MGLRQHSLLPYCVLIGVAYAVRKILVDGMKVAGVIERRTTFRFASKVDRCDCRLGWLRNEAEDERRVVITRWSYTKHHVIIGA